MNTRTKGICQLVLLFVIAFAFCALQQAGGAPPQTLTSPSTQAKTSMTGLAPGATVDPSGVIVFSQEQVQQSSLTAGMLYNGNPERNYRVHIFRRDKPGEVEVHDKDTDVFYIIDGSATLATGGTTVGGKETAPDEIRGSAMKGGMARKVSKGEVVIIPAKVPHWFKEIEQPITYFTVKIR
jgi:quercetin dioxygenase-like cupin family protein